MKQFTVYAKDERTGESGPAYVINFTADRVVAYAVREGWKLAARRMEDGLNMTGLRPVAQVRQPLACEVEMRR